MAQPVSLVSTKTHTYGNRRLGVDDEFTANRQHARLLVALGRAKEINGMKAEPKPVAKTPAKAKAKPKAAAKKATKKGSYKRRDVQPSETK
jgi:hypothetical protein